ALGQTGFATDCSHGEGRAALRTEERDARGDEFVATQRLPVLDRNTRPTTLTLTARHASPRLVLTTHVVILRLARMGKSSDSRYVGGSRSDQRSRYRLSGERRLRRAPGAARPGFPDLEILRRLARHAAGSVGRFDAKHAPAARRGGRAALDLPP